MNIFLKIYIYFLNINQNIISYKLNYISAMYYILYLHKMKNVYIFYFHIQIIHFYTMFTYQTLVFYLKIL